MPQFEHDNIEFHFRETGSGLPFIFQHGLGADSSQPFDLFDPPAGIRMITLDARAHGKTRPAGQEHKLGFDTFANDLAALLDHLGLDQAVMGGISMGAGMTLNFTIRYPHRVIGLVQSRPAWLEAPCPWNVDMFSLITHHLREHGPVEGEEKFRATPQFKETEEKWPDVATSMAMQFRSPQAAETAGKYERIIRDVPSSDRDAWAGIPVPTLVLANHQDPVHPFAYGESLADTIPQATLREITPKSVSLEKHTEDVQEHLESFLNAILTNHS